METGGIWDRLMGMISGVYTYTRVCAATQTRHTIQSLNNDIIFTWQLLNESNGRSKWSKFITSNNNLHLEANNFRGL